MQAALMRHHLSKAAWYLGAPLEAQARTDGARWHFRQAWVAAGVRKPVFGRDLMGLGRL